MKGLRVPQVSNVFVFLIHKQLEDETGTSEFSFTPPCGVLGPEESKEVAVLYTPTETCRVRTVLQCDVKNGKTRYEMSR